MDIDPIMICQGDGSKQCLPQKVEGRLLMRKGRYLHHISLNQIHPREPTDSPARLDWNLGRGAASTWFWWMDESLFHIPHLWIIMYHTSLDRSHSIHPVCGPPTLKFYIMLVHLHVQAPDSEETPSWLLGDVFIPYTASKINESSCSLNDF